MKPPRAVSQSFFKESNFAPVLKLLSDLVFLEIL